MSIDEAITHCLEVADGQTAQGKCPECAADHRQLAEWLKDYKRLKEQEPCEDAISRQEVLDMMQMRMSSKELYKAVYDLPPVNPQEPKTGHWIFDEILDKHYYCSECKSMGVDYWDFCPNCGARMIEPQESEVQE